MDPQFSLQCPRKTTCDESFLENDKMRRVFKYMLTDGHCEVQEEFALSFLQDSAVDDNERILKLGEAGMENLFNLSSIWLIDGPFKLSPETFYQFYTVFAQLHNFALFLLLCCKYSFFPSE